MNLDEDKSFCSPPFIRRRLACKGRRQGNGNGGIGGRSIRHTHNPGEHTVEMKFIPSGFVLVAAYPALLRVTGSLAVYKPKKKETEPAEEVKEISQTENQENERTTDSSEETEGNKEETS